MRGGGGLNVAVRHKSQLLKTIIYFYSYYFFKHKPKPKTKDMVSSRNPTPKLNKKIFLNFSNARKVNN